MLITIFSGFLRICHFDESSLWSDELYTMLTLHPDNSWKDVLILQINDNQPPMYMVVLKSLFSIFSYDEYKGKFFSIILSVVSVFAIGVCNLKLFDARTGLMSAFLLGLSTTQIEHSYEVRFYSLVVLSSVVIFYIFFGRRKKEIDAISWRVTFLFTAFLGFAVLVHYFFIFLLMALSISDAHHLWKSKMRSFSITLKWLLPYVASILVFVLWIIIVSKYQTQNSSGYWLKRIDVLSFVFYPFGSSTVISLFLIGVILYSLKLGSFQESATRIFFIICLFNIGILTFSYLKYPISVPRYSLVLTPFFVTFVGIKLSSFYDIKNKLISAIPVVFIILFCIEVSIFSFGSDYRRAKEPWREMARYISSQPDCNSTPILSFGYMLHDKFTINYYLPKFKIMNFGYVKSDVLAMDSFYLIQTNGHDKLNENDSFNLSHSFVVETVRFGFDKYGKGGSVSKYRKSIR